MDTWDDEQPRPQTVETVENGGLDEFADEGEGPGAPVPPIAAEATSERTEEAARESVEPTIASAAGVAAPPAAAAIVIGVSSALRRGAVFVHARVSRLFRQPAWCDALSPAEIRTLRGLVALVVVLVYAGLVIGIWNRAVASDRRRALASAEVALAQPSTPPPVPAPIAPSPIAAAPIAAAPIAAPSLTPPAPTPAPVPTPPTTPVTAVPAPVKAVPAPPVKAVPRPPVARRARAQAPKPVQSPRPRTPSAPRPPASPASPNRTPSLAVDGSRSESERDWTRAAVAPVAAPPAGAIAGEARLVAEPAAAVVTAVDPLAADRSAVTAVLAAYRKSYNTLDARSASAIWEGADERALRRAFSSLSHQNVSFDRCDVRLPAGDRAVARCDGVLSYVAKVGDSSAQQRRMTWNMDFRRKGDHWKIVNVTAR